MSIEMNIRTLKIIVVLFIAALLYLLSGCNVQRPTCLQRESNRYQSSLNSGSHTPMCLTPDVQRYQRQP